MGYDGGGRHNCCQFGPCGTHLAEQHPDGGTYSTLHTGNGIACVWNQDDQALAVAFTVAAIDHARQQMGLL